jgi:hypothetical protein
MKNIDLENLPKKNKGEIPEGFFQEMQNFVVENTIHKNKTRIFPLKWIGAIAATVVLLMGLIFLLPKSEQKMDKTITAEISKNTAVEIEKSTTEATTKLLENKTNKELVSISLPKKPKEVFKQELKETNSTDNMDQVLSVLSERELTEMANRNQPDIYLDLYY